MLEAVIFDMDGVIFDSEALVISTWKQVADKYGISGIEDTCMECLGTNSEATVRIFQKNYGKDFPYAVYKKEMAELFHEQAAGGKLPKKKGVIELLEYLHYRDIKVGLATSTREEVVKKELSEGGLFEYFDEIICGDMVKRSKPEQDIYLEACKRLQVSPENCYGIEDSYNGIRALKGAGMHAVMVPDLANPTKEMEELAECILPSLLEVKKYLEEVV